MAASVAASSSTALAAPPSSSATVSAWAMSPGRAQLALERLLPRHQLCKRRRKRADKAADGKVVRVDEEAAEPIDAAIRRAEDDVERRLEGAEQVGEHRATDVVGDALVDVVEAAARCCAAW